MSNGTRLLPLSALFLAAFGFISCGDNTADGAYGSRLSATIEAVQAAAGFPAYTTWSGVVDKRVAVRADGVVKTYYVDNGGMLDCAEPFQLNADGTLVIDAWHPFNNGVLIQNVTVKSDQSVPANYHASDCIGVFNATVSADNTNIIFLHRTAKVVCRVSSEAEQNFLLSIDGVTGVTGGGNSVTMTADNMALLAPQTLVGGSVSITAHFSDGYFSQTVLSDDLVLEAGNAYYFDVTISAERSLIAGFIGNT